MQTRTESKQTSNPDPAAAGLLEATRPGPKASPPFTDILRAVDGSREAVYQAVALRDPGTASVNGYRVDLEVSFVLN